MAMFLSFLQTEKLITLILWLKRIFHLIPKDFNFVLIFLFKVSFYDVRVEKSNNNKGNNIRKYS
jgi:hypothetical protein